MLEIRNRTPYQVEVIPQLDLAGRDFATVLVKGTFGFPMKGGPAPVAEMQVGVAWGDEHWGEPDSSSLRCESDTAPAKGGTDVVLVGHAYAPRGRATEVDVTLSAGGLRKTVRVFGDRHWSAFAGTRRISRAEAFERMPLVYERAYGGADRSRKDASRHTFEPRNPVGMGHHSRRRLKGPEERRLPNLEDPRELITSPRQRPPPTGFGFIARSWEPRQGFAGTYDDAWERDRCPLLPWDFDVRYYRCAHPDLQAPSHFEGGEVVRATNVSPDGEIQFAVPGVKLDVTVSSRGEETVHAPALDTLLIEPDDRRVVCCWRVDVPCSRLVLHLDWVRIKELARTA